MKTKIFIDVNSRSGAAFHEAILELPWQKTGEAFAHHRYDISVSHLASGSSLKTPTLIKGDPVYLYRGHGALDPQMTRDGYVHATPLPDIAIGQYCIFNGGGPVSISSPQLEAALDAKVSRLSFISVYEAKIDQIFYSDEQLELKKRGHEVEGRKLADITHFDASNHFETEIDCNAEPTAMYVVLGSPRIMKDDGAIGSLQFQARVAKIMENGEYTEVGARLLHHYRSITQEGLPKAKPTQFEKCGLS